MSFQWPLALLALLLVPLTLGAYVLLERRRARYAVRFTNLEVLAAVVGSTRAWRRWVPVALFLLALALTLAGLARPHVPRTTPREQASIVLLIDSSGSMFAEDVKPTRLGAVKVAVRHFVKTLPKQFRIAAVAFAGEPQVIAPFTHDRELVTESLEYLYPARGTAIGDALARSVQLIRDDAPPGRRPPPSAIILLSDGQQMGGTLEPLQGAQRAASYRIPVHTIALGTPQGKIVFGSGPYQRTIDVPPDPATLRQIARLTKGRFAEVRDAERLNDVYETLGSKVGRIKQKQEATHAFLGVAALLLVAASLLSTRAQRLP